MKPESILNFNPDVIGAFFRKLDDTLFFYTNYYFARLDNVTVDVKAERFTPQERTFDVVLTSPPYGDSRTTVAYGQFSTFGNEWLDVKNARKIDAALMGGVKCSSLYHHGLIADFVRQIAKEDKKRALDVSAFYNDLGDSIKMVAASVKKRGKIVYVVGNRTVKNVQLPTDQFIAEQFEENGCKHLVTYTRVIGNKSMPSKNSPTNEPGKTVNTMLFENIVVCEKRK